MKKLLLIRHAKSDWDHPGLADHDRPLNGRGLRDAPRMATALFERGIVPDLVATSTAVRAATTAEMLAKGLNFPGDRIQRFSELYLAAPRTILATIRGFDESVGTALLFGHNPGLHETVNLLDEGSGMAEFPTLAVASFDLEIDYWGEIAWDGGHLVESLIPRRLG